jgi:hypothetical protein
MTDSKQVEQELTRQAEAASEKRVNAAKAQKEQIVRIAQEQSDRRIEIAMNETSKLNREINRRYRNERQVLQDNWDDEARARENILENRANAQIKSLQRQEQNEINYMQRLAQAQGKNATASTDHIRNMYETRIQAIRDSLENELTEQRRASRDQQQLISDQLEDRRDLELRFNDNRLNAIRNQESAFTESQRSAAQKRFNEIESLEKTLLDKAKNNAKVVGEELAKNSAQGFADRMQSDAVGTVMEVLSRISNLPKSQQLSVISDLFGDEARALAPLISNIKELERVLGLADDKTKAAGSVLKEYATRSDTVANKLIILKNSFSELKTVIGDAFMPVLNPLLDVLLLVSNALTNVAKFLSPVIEWATKALIFGKITSVIFGFGMALGGIISIFSSVKWIAGLSILAGLPTPIRLLAGALTLLGVSASPLAPVLNAVLAGLTALQFLNFAKNFVLFIPAAISGLTAFIGFLGSTVVPALVAFFSGPVGWTVLAVAAVVAMVVLFRKPLLEFAAWLWKWGEPLRKFFVDLWNNLPKATSDAFNATNKWISDNFMKYISTPISKAWTTVTEILPKIMAAAANSISNIWNGMLQGIRNAINSVFAGINKTINDWISGINSVIRAISSTTRVSLPQVPLVNIPRFATGAYVTGPTIAQVGEGGQPEYVIPSSKMASASAAYLGGARGVAVLNGSAPGGGRPVVNIQTGPVMQQADGSRWVSLDDAAAMVRQAVDQLRGELAQPSTRAALGVG